MKIKKLTSQQESTLLKELLNCEAIGSGASRIVYKPTDAAKEIIGANNFVIKVAIGIGGLNQNKLEQELYEAHGDHLPLAHILCAGDYIEVMEEVNPVDTVYRDFDEFGIYADECSPDDLEYFCDETGMDITEAYEVYNIVGEISVYTGDTSDNAQVGYNGYGDLVAYDYGFESCSEKVLCSRVDFITYGMFSNLLKEYLLSLSSIVLIKHNTTDEVFNAVLALEEIAIKKADEMRQTRQEQEFLKELKHFDFDKYYIDDAFYKERIIDIIQRYNVGININLEFTEIYKQLFNYCHQNILCNPQKTGLGSLCSSLMCFMEWYNREIHGGCVDNCEDDSDDDDDNDCEEHCSLPYDPDWYESD